MTSKKFILFLLLILWIYSSSYAQILTVSRVEVQGNKSADKSLILLASGFTPGFNLDQNSIQRAIRRIYGLGLFSDVTITATQTEGGVALTIGVQEYPKLAQLEIAGNKKFKTQEIEQKLGLKAGMQISPQQVKEGINVIQGLYRDKGYAATTVQSELKPGPKEEEVVLDYKINEGQKVKIRKIYIQGNKAYTEGKVRKQMKTKQASLLRSGEFNSDKYQEDKGRITDFYKKNGYLDAEILSDSFWFDPSGKDMFVRIALSEGERYKFGEVSFHGNTIYPEEKLRKAVKFKPGEFYDQKKYEETLTELNNL
ncbi:MAG TPA: POTRA domain-containing protein, partial [Terriglobales bacterium]|nr:POTRA domain-containing protein [Terriglobales bacterium]